jgi:hypothetical protein
MVTTRTRKQLFFGLTIRYIIIEENGNNEGDVESSVELVLDSRDSDRENDEDLLEGDEIFKLDLSDEEGSSIRVASLYIFNITSNESRARIGHLYITSYNKYRKRPNLD